MKITGVEPLLCEGYYQNWVFVKVTTDEGLVGWGDATDFPGEPIIAEAVRYLARYVVGESPLNIEKVWNKMYFGMYSTGKTINGAITGIETALWDILGKVAGLPVYQLLGGCREKVRLYVHCDAFEEGDKLDMVARKAKRVVKEGFTCIKTHPSQLGTWKRSVVRLNRQMDPETLRCTVDKVQAIRETIGADMDLCIDLNGLLNVPSAIKLGRALEPYDLLFFEDPIPQREGSENLRRVKRDIKTPMCVGEILYNVYEFKQILEADAVDLIHPDVVHCGGLSQAKKIAALAEAYNVPMALHNLNSPLSTLISAHFAAGIPNFLIMEFTHPDVPWRDKVISEPLKVEHGYLELPQRPGFGVEIVEEEVAKHPYRIHERCTWISEFQVV